MGRFSKGVWMNCGIYQIRNTKNDKIYIGSSKNIENRWLRHLQELRNGSHHNIKLQRAFNKYGEKSFVLEVVESTPDSLLLEREQYYLDELRPYETGYNIGKLASGGDNLTYHPHRDKIIRKIVEGVKKSKSQRTEEQKREYIRKITGSGNPNYGKRWNDEQRLKMSKRRKGAKASKETKEKISQVSKLRWQSEEFKQREKERRKGSGNSFYGKQHTQKTKDAISKKQKERYDGMSFEEKQKIIPNLKKIKVGKSIFDSLADAAKELGVCRQTIANRIKNSNFPDYNFVED
jgi:group I intron endonuclease